MGKLEKHQIDYILGYYDSRLSFLVLEYERRMMGTEGPRREDDALEARRDARSLFDTMVAHATKHKRDVPLPTYYMMGTIFYDLGDFKESAAYFRNGVKIYRAYPDKHGLDFGGMLMGLAVSELADCMKKRAVSADVLEHFLEAERLVVADNVSGFDTDSRALQFIVHGIGRRIYPCCSYIQLCQIMRRDVNAAFETAEHFRRRIFCKQLFHQNDVAPFRIPDDMANLAQAEKSTLVFLSAVNAFGMNLMLYCVALCSGRTSLVVFRFNGTVEAPSDVSACGTYGIQLGQSETTPETAGASHYTTTAPTTDEIGDIQDSRKTNKAMMTSEGKDEDAREQSRVWWDLVLKLTSRLQLQEAPRGSATSSRMRMIIFPDGELWNVPFTELNATSDDPYAIALAPCMTSIKMWREERIRIAHASVYNTPFALLVGNPDFRGKLKQLPQAERECDEVQKQLTSTIAGFRCASLLGEQATKTALLQGIRECAILHIASHGSEESLHGRLPGYVSLAQDDDPEGCHLDSAEISELDMHAAELVFLNCCVTGKGSSNLNGLFGLGRAFLLAGAKAAVLTTNVILDAAETVEFVGKFYEFYGGSGKERGKPDFALHSAQQFAMQRRIDKRIWASYYVLRAA